MTSPLSLFYSYSHKDEDLRDRLETHLATLKRQNLIQQWHDRKILPGEKWAGKIDENLESAEIILLLISSDFIASDYCFELEMKRAIERHEAKEAIVIPIALRPADCTGLPFAEIQGLPKNFKPVTTWNNQDEAFLNVVTGIRAVVQRIQERKAVRSLKNPFEPLSGRVDDPMQFFGRDRELQRIFELLESRNSVAVIGDREIGKSSLLRAVYRNCQPRLGRVPIYLDLNSIESDEDFYEELCHQAGVATCQGARLKRSLSAKRLVLLLDEVEKMTWRGFTHGLRSQLRGLAEGADAPLRLVLAAGSSLDRLFPDGQDGMTSPLAGICLEERVGKWGNGEMGEFLARKLRGLPIQFTSEEIERLIEESGGYPKRLMRGGYELFRQYQYR